jgi:HEAT repeat protein
VREYADVATQELLERVTLVVHEDPSSERNERWRLIDELHLRAEDVVFQAAAAWCRATDIPIQLLGADLLGQIRAHGNYPFADRSAAVLEPLLYDPQPDVVSHALDALGHLAVGDLDAICACAEHSSSDVRKATASCLGQRFEDRSWATLIALSADVERSVRWNATFGLAYVGEFDMPILREALAARCEDEAGNVRQLALCGLAIRHDPRAIPGLAALLAEGILDDHLIEAVEALPAREYIPAFQAMLVLDPLHENARLLLDRCQSA